MTDKRLAAVIKAVGLYEQLADMELDLGSLVLEYQRFVRNIAREAGYTSGSIIMDDINFSISIGHLVTDIVSKNLEGEGEGFELTVVDYDGDTVSFFIGLDYFTDINHYRHTTLQYFCDLKLKDAEAAVTYAIQNAIDASQRLNDVREQTRNVLDIARGSVKESQEG